MFNWYEIFWQDKKKCTVYTVVYICSVYCMVCIFAVYAVISYSVNNTIYLYLVSININCTNNVYVTHCVVSYMCILFCYNVCCFLYLFLCFSKIFFAIWFFLFFKSDINKKILYLHTVSNVKMKILWFEWLIISLLKLLNRNWEWFQVSLFSKLKYFLDRITS